MPKRAPRNRTLSCTSEELDRFSREFLSIDQCVGVETLANRVIHGDTFEMATRLPRNFVDLLVLDPPYNLSKNFNGVLFREKEKTEYQRWFTQLLETLSHTLKKDATIYICSDWKTSIIILPILESFFFVRNRITWEREKGRGSKSNWKNNTEDIWYCTNSEEYYFDVDAVKLKRKVIAPYRSNGRPKDWNEESNGNYRLTHPSNIWTDITVPFWSMPENTDHPTQKPEKLLAKLILASSKTDDFIFDPFLGSGTTAAVASKLGRRWAGIELNAEYLCWALKRVESVETSASIQGYSHGIFWERNTPANQNRESNVQSTAQEELSL